jgi:hypothetical protein
MHRWIGQHNPEFSSEGSSPLLYEAVHASVLALLPAAYRRCYTDESPVSRHERALIVLDQPRASVARARLHLELYPDFAGRRVPDRIYTPPRTTATHTSTYTESIHSPLARVFSHAVPTAKAVAVLARLGSGVLELGAGSGHWASVLRTGGVDVLAYNATPPPFQWTEVLEGGAEVLADRGHAERALMLCWPVTAANAGSVWDAEALAAYTGDTVVYVGALDTATKGALDGFEGLAPAFGCHRSSSHQFQRRLVQSFELRTCVELPRWLHCLDTLTVWSRRRPSYVLQPNVER